MEAIKLAKYIIAKSDNVGDLITNKKLQKLLYYIKAWGVVYFADGIIGDQFEAWVHGPVCPSVYAEFKPFGYMPLSIDYHGTSSSEYIRVFMAENASSQQGRDMMDLVDAVFLRYAVHSSLKLEQITHSEEPWIEARKGLAPLEKGHAIIKESTMKRFYGAKVEDNDEEYYTYDDPCKAESVERGIKTVLAQEKEGELETPDYLFDEIEMYS